MGSDILIAAKSGSQEAMRLILDKFEPLIRFLARQREDRLYYDDYIQAARIGLLEAVGRADPYIGGSFTSYAAYYMKSEMHRLTCTLRDLSWNDYQLMSRYYKRQREMEQNEQRTVDLLEVIGTMSLMPYQVDIIKTYAHRQLISMDALEDTRDIDYAVVDAKEMLKDGRIRFISEMISQLTDIQAYIVKRCYVDGIPQTEIAKEVGWKTTVASKLGVIKKRFRGKWPAKLFEIAYNSGQFFNVDYTFHMELWKRVKGMQAVYMVSNYGRVHYYDRVSNQFVIKPPEKDRNTYRYRLNDSGKYAYFTAPGIIGKYFTMDELPTFYERS